MPDQSCDLDAMAPDVMLDLPEAPRPVVVKAIRDTVRDFCDRSHAWLEIIDPIQVAEGVDTYEIYPPLDGEVIMVKAIRDPLGHDVRFTADPSGSVTLAWRTGTLGQTIRPTPGALLEVEAVLMPTRDAKQAPAWILNHHWDGLVAGAKSRMQMQPGKPWTAPEIGAYNRGLFSEAVTKAKARRMRGHTHGNMRVQMRPWV